MKTLGISGRHRDAAAAVAIDGRVVAATSEDCLARMPGIGYSATGGAPLGAVAASLRIAGLDGADIDEVVIVNDEGDDAGALENGEASDALAAVVPRARRRGVGAADSDALQAAVTAPDGAAVLVCCTEPAGLVAYRRGPDGLRRSARLAGADRLLCAARMAARALGLNGDDPYNDLDGLTAADPAFVDLLKSGLTWSDAHGVTVDVAQIGNAIETIRQHADGDLNGSKQHTFQVEEARRALAASMRRRVAEVLHEAATHVCRREGIETIALGGSLFGNAQLNTEVQRLFAGSTTVAPVPEAAGRSLGAALAGDGRPGRIDSVSIGPAFTDSDIKRTLDNCRLDYVYEPDFERLIDRTSKLLAQGKVIAWFQGPMAFGPRPLGSRSVLCDPSLRYARENMNEYLRQVPLDEPLPVAVAPAAADEILKGHAGVFGTYDAAIPATSRDRLRAALDRQQQVRISGSVKAAGPELQQLLDRHFARTGVPGLIETGLRATGEPIVCTPRDAVRTVYSSAIDALVIGRFLLMKDYWLLRSDSGA